MGAPEATSFFEGDSAKGLTDHVGPRALRRLLDSVVTVGSDLELAVVLRRVVEAAVELVDARYGALGVLDESGTHLVEFIVVGDDDDDDTQAAIGPLPKGLGLLEALINDAKPLRVADLSEYPGALGFPFGHSPTTFLGVPVWARGRLFGDLYLTDKTSGEVFTDVDEELALALASAAGVAIANARLFDQLRQREAALSSMHQIADTLLAGTSPADSLALVARHARALVGAELSTIEVLETDSETLRIDVAEGALGDELAGERFPVAGSASGEALRGGQMVVMEDASKDGRTRQPQVRRGGIGPAVWVALSGEGQLVGTLCVARAVGEAPFVARELELVRSFAAQASIILQHDRARHDLQRVEVLEGKERIARELHDVVIHRLFAIGLSLAGVGALKDLGAAQVRVGAAVDELDATIRQIRGVIFDFEHTESSSTESGM
jgi:GAF domain-containing protein